MCTTGPINYGPPQYIPYRLDPSVVPVYAPADNAGTICSGNRHSAHCHTGLSHLCQAVSRSRRPRCTGLFLLMKAVVVCSDTDSGVSATCAYVRGFEVDLALKEELILVARDCLRWPSRRTAAFSPQEKEKENRGRHELLFGATGTCCVSRAYGAATRLRAVVSEATLDGDAGGREGCLQSKR